MLRVGRLIGCLLVLLSTAVSAQEEQVPSDPIEDGDYEDALEELGMGIWETYETVIMDEIEENIDINEVEEIFKDDPWLVPIVVGLGVELLEPIVSEVERDVDYVFGSEIDIDTLPLPSIDIQLENSGITFDTDILLDANNDIDGLLIWVRYDY